MLRKYQSDIVAGCKAAWDSGLRNVMPVCATGSGKTKIMSHVAAHHDGPGVAIAHRGVLVGQISMALANEGLMHDIIAPKAVVKTIIQAQMEEYGRNYYNPSAHWKVASVDTMPGRAAELSRWVNSVTLGFTDECFPAGTLVDGRPIESIDVGDVVNAYDDRSGEFSRCRVTRLFKSPMPSELVLVKVGHHVLQSTKGHPFWTRRGWVPAALLTVADEVLTHGLHELRRNCCDHQRGTKVSAQEDRADFLHSDVRLQASRQGSGAEANAKRNKELRELRKTFSSDRLEVALQNPFMQQCLCGATPRCNQFGDDDEHEPSVCKQSDEEKQPDAAEGCEKQSGCNSKDSEPQAEHPWWKWAWVDGMRTAIAGAVIALGLRRKLGCPNGEAARLPVSLQAGLGAPCAKNCSRSGRTFSQRLESKATGQQERGVSAWQRVDSVSIYEPTSADGNFVYNIEVDSLHTYVANGVVVHNCHHVLANNKWGRECARFTHPDMRWLLPTATPERADGKGLGRSSHGIADVIVEGPPMRWLINNGYLTDYVIRAPLPADLDLSDVEVGANGEYNQKQLRRAVHRSTKIIGNVVDTYRERTPGMLGIVFAVDIEHATALTAEFNTKGVKAELITADHSEEQRRAILRRYANRETLVLVNVDLFGEGFDLPAIEVVMMARPTASYALFAQQFGRALRLLIDKLYMANWESYTPEQRLAVIRASRKPVAYIHDHVGNVLHFFGPPDKPREWSLEPRASRRSGPSDAIPLRVCANWMCLQPYERFYPRCPYCGMEPPVPAGASLPEQIDGDITLYTPEMLARLFGVESAADALARGPDQFCAVPPGMSDGVVRAIQHRHQDKLRLQAELGRLMPVVMPPNVDQRENMRKFFHRYGVDVVQARLLAAKDTEELIGKLMLSMGVDNRQS